MDQQTYIIKFDDVTAAQASLYANELGNKLLNAAPEIDIEHRRDNANTQDFGATLVLILGTPAIIAAAKALGDWLKLHHSTTLTIEDLMGKNVQPQIYQGKMSPN